MAIMKHNATCGTSQNSANEKTQKYILCNKTEDGNISHIFIHRLKDHYNQQLIAVKYTGNIRNEVASSYYQIINDLNKMNRSLKSETFNLRSMRKFIKKINKMGIKTIDDFCIMKVINGKIVPLDPVEDKSLIETVNKISYSNFGISGFIPYSCLKHVIKKKSDYLYVGFISLNKVPVNSFPRRILFDFIKLCSTNEKILNELNNSLTIHPRLFNQTINELKIKGVSTFKGRKASYTVFFKDDDAFMNFKLALPTGVITKYKLSDIKKYTEVKQ